MSSFLKTLLASCLGMVIALALLSIIGVSIVAGVASSADKPRPVKPNSVLYLTLDKPIPDLTNNTENAEFSLKNDKTLGLTEIIATLEQAKQDDQIKGIFLEVDNVMAPMAKTAALREALLDFKESGKFILSYSDFYGQQAYHLSTASDEIYVNPIGLVDFRGFSATVPFFKDMLDKVGIHMQVFYAGKFKSATEPYRRNDMSSESKFQTRVLLEELYGRMLQNIAETRGISVQELRDLANNFTGLDPKAAMEAGMVDEVIPRDEIFDRIRDRIGLNEDEDIPFVSLENYNLANPPSVNVKANNKIAVVYAEGAIVGGEGQNGNIGDKKYSRVIRKLGDQKNLKAVVLRVNSPGGSALASENIMRELNTLRDNGIPVVVSMGDYAASGGYYISCQADSILAEPSTVTGSIGVFSLIPDLSNLMNDKLGIHFDTVNTGQLSSGFTLLFPFNEKERALMNQRTDQMYRIFLDRVATGRKMSVDEVKEIAQGRVWTGTRALDIGLVDKLGDLEDAIAVAAGMAGLNEGEYRISNYPKVKDPLMALLEELTGGEDEQVREILLREELGEMYPHYKHLRQMISTEEAQARLPMTIEF